MVSRRILRSICDNSRGAAAATVALTVPLFLIAAAAAVDMGSAYIARNGLQIAADAAALAGASALPEATSVKSRSNAAAEANLSASGVGDVLKDADIVLGNWNSGTRVFTTAAAGGSPLNAVRVITRRQAANGNAMPSIFAGIFGRATFDVDAVAIATSTSTNDCFRNGLVANGMIEAGSDDTFGVGACMHGQLGVKIGSSNEFQEGAVISMPDLSMLIQGSDNVWDGELIEQEMEAMSADEVDELIDDIETTTSGDSVIDGLNAAPAWWNGTVQHIAGDFSNCNPTDGVLYIATGKADLSSCTGSLENFGIVADGEIKLPSGSSSDKFDVINMFFAGRSIETGSYLNIGAATCEMAGGAVFLAARDFMKFGSNVNMTGVQMIAGAKDGSLSNTGVEFGTDLHTSGVTAQSAGMIKLGSNPLVSVCDRADHVLAGGGVNKVLRLVD